MNNNLSQRPPFNPALMNNQNNMFGTIMPNQNRFQGPPTQMMPGMPIVNRFGTMPVGNPGDMRPQQMPGPMNPPYPQGNPGIPVNQMRMPTQTLLPGQIINPNLNTQPRMMNVQMMNMNPQMRVQNMGNNTMMNPQLQNPMNMNRMMMNPNIRVNPTMMMGNPNMGRPPFQQFQMAGPNMRMAQPGMVRPQNPAINLIQPNEKESKIIEALFKKDYDLTLLLISEYDAKKGYSFWKNYIHCGQAFHFALLSSADETYAAFLLGILCGGEYYDAALIHLSMHKNLDKPVIVGLSIMKNIKKRLPDKAFSLLFKKSPKDALTDWKHDGGAFCAKIFKTLRRQKEKNFKEKAHEDAIKLFKSINENNVEEISKVFMIYSKERLLEISKTFYESFGISIIEFAEFKEIGSNIVEFLRNTLAVKISYPHYVCYMIIHISKMEEKDILLPYLMSTIMRLDKSKLQGIFEVMASRSVSKFIKDHLNDNITSYICKKI